MKKFTYNVTLQLDLERKILIFLPVMYIRMLIFLLSFSEKAEFLNSKYNHNRFSFATFGSLTSNNNILFITEQNLHSRVILNCSNFCRKDRRCIGMEVCRIKEELFRCRACCSWMITNKQQFISADNCKYLKKVCLCYALNLQL